MMRRQAAALLAALALAAVPAAVAQEAEKPAEAKPAGTTFHFGTSDARTTIAFESETSVEVIHGTCSKISGTALLDFDKGEGSTELKVPVEAMDTRMEERNKHLQSDSWLDAAKFPDIVFKAKTLKRAKTDEATKRETWAYEGELTIHGVTKALKGEAEIQRVPEDLGKKLGRGDWVRVKTDFQVTIKDFDIVVPEVAAAKVAPTWDIRVVIFGTTQPPKKEKE